MSYRPDHITLHDIAFDGRNKAYGAYVLRITANRRIGFSLFFSILIFLLLISIISISLKYLGNEQVVYRLPSISVGLDNSIPSIFSASWDSRETGLNHPGKTIKSKPQADWGTVTESSPSETIPGTSSESNEVIEKSTENASTSGMGIPWGNEEVFLSADVIPQFTGGREGLSEYLKKNVHYPEGALERRLQGTVLVCFVVNRFGEIKDVKIVKGIDPLLDNEALRVVNAMPAWKPGKRAGKPVNIVLTLPIRFDLHLRFRL